MEEPIHPVGTPEYEAYAAELRTELAQFAKGEEPYPYRREATTMATVPNWIGHALVIRPSSSSLRPDEAVRVASWRATKTQVVVTLDNPGRSEIRFYLDGLCGVGTDRSCELLDAHSPATLRRVAFLAYRGAVSELETVMAITRLDRIRSNPEALAVEIGKLRDAATNALAAIADVL
jgi:hypothetical protein